MTDLELQAGVARALGVPADVAADAVAAMERHGVLAHGALFLAVMAAARWGTDAPGALRRIAEGAEPPASWSDYEERAAREESAEEAAAALRRHDTEPLAPRVAAELRRWDGG